jgi:hypothetical protein
MCQFFLVWVNQYISNVCARGRRTKWAVGTRYEIETGHGSSIRVDVELLFLNLSFLYQLYFFTLTQFFPDSFGGC